MKNEKGFRLIMALLLGLALIFGALAFAPVLAVSNFDAIQLRGIVGTATPVLQIDSRGVPAQLRINSTPVFQVDGDGLSNSAGGFTFTGDVAVDDTFNIDDTLTTISGTQTVTPTYSVMTVAPSVASTITLATGSASAGDFLLVLNTVATNTNIVDTGATAGGAAIDLGANDIALFIYLNSKWVEIASPDNS